MNRKLLVFIGFLALTLAGFTSCNSCNRANKEGFVISDSIYDGELPVSQVLMEEMVDNIASPIELASLVKSLDLPFAQRHLASPKNVSNYHTSHEMAFVLGIFGCDLGYINMYGKTSLVLDYSTAIRTLADGINVGQFFDFHTLRRLVTSNQNVDSLVHVSQLSFNRMDRYLQRNNRGNLSILMIAGVWVEGLYLSTQFLKERPNVKRLAESICEQKLMLDRLILILKNYGKEQYIANLVAELTTIKNIYDGIRLTIEPGEVQAVEVNGRLTFVQTDITTSHYTDEHMQAIIAQAEIVRNKLIK